MEFLKNLFKDGAITFEQFAEAAKSGGIKLADLSKGEYVSKRKYDDDINAKNGEITTLNENITAKDGDIEKLRGELKGREYEFAVKEFANSQRFTSGAAKREFIRGMTQEALELKDGAIQGAEDFLREYKSKNADSFAQTEDKKPKFADKSGGGKPSEETGDPFLNGFNGK